MLPDLLFPPYRVPALVYSHHWLFELRFGCFFHPFITNKIVLIHLIESLLPLQHPLHVCVTVWALLVVKVLTHFKSRTHKIHCVLSFLVPLIYIFSFSLDFFLILLALVQRNFCSGVKQCSKLRRLRDRGNLHSFVVREFFEICLINRWFRWSVRDIYPHRFLLNGGHL